MKIGDKVSVVDEDLSGVVTSTRGNMVVFRDEYGFTHQYPGNKLVPKDDGIYENIRIIRKAEQKKVVSKKHQKTLWYWISIFITWLGIPAIMTILKGYSCRRKN